MVPVWDAIIDVIVARWRSLEPTFPLWLPRSTAFGARGLGARGAGTGTSVVPAGSCCARLHGYFLCKYVCELPKRPGPSVSPGIESLMNISQLSQALSCGPRSFQQRPLAYTTGMPRARARWAPSPGGPLRSLSGNAINPPRNLEPDRSGVLDEAWHACARSATNA